MIKVVVSQQMLFHHRKTGVVRAYPISTASKGVGNLKNSWQTPLGKHRICSKIGEGMLRGTSFVGRKAGVVFHQSMQEERSDWILSRILWLDGMQAGINKRGAVDSKARYIYIHGTNEEDMIGSPASHGCIRMKNDDVIDLFEHAQCDESVVIKR